VASTTNPAKALWDAIGALSRCPDTARRVIIIATDGIPSCGFNRRNPGGTPTPDPVVDCPPTPQIPTDYYPNYLEGEAALLGVIKDELVRRGISVTALLDADNIQPNFINATVQPGTPTPGSVYVSPEDAAKYGYCGVASGGCIPFFNSTPAIGTGDFAQWAEATGCTEDCEDRYAFHAKDRRSGALFRRPNALWGQLAMDTGGTICPLLPECPASWYLPVTPPEVAQLRPEVRATVSVLNCSPLQLTKTQQGINCVLAAVGVNPYQNVEEIPVTTTPSASTD
jgi:hypothetical protein